RPRSTLPLRSPGGNKPDSLGPDPRARAWALTPGLLVGSLGRGLGSRAWSPHVGPRTGPKDWAQTVGTKAEPKDLDWGRAALPHSRRRSALALLELALVPLPISCDRWLQWPIAALGWRNAN